MPAPAHPNGIILPVEIHTEPYVTTLYRFCFCMHKCFVKI